MEKATWEEIKSLASDFKRAQATSTNLKLSERNCIDIINYLINANKISLYFTTDGKTFLTPEELKKEIYEELEFANGRVSLAALSNNLDIDMSIIESNVNIMLQKDVELQLVMNYLINSSYVRQVILKINDLLKSRGKSTIGELTQLYELPKLFIEKLIVTNISTSIDAHKDGDMIYTNSFIRRRKAMIRGYLSRSSKSVTISSLSLKYQIPEKLTIKIIDELLEQNRLFGKFDNGKFLFIPDIYLKNQKTYVKEFFMQNNYVEFSMMKDVGIQFPSKFAEIEFQNEMIMSSCIIGKNIMSQFEAAVQECDRCNGFLNCYECVPSIVDEQDLINLVNNVCKQYERLRFVGTEFLVSDTFIDICISSFDEIIKIKAEEFVRLKKKSHGNVSERSLSECLNDDSECNVKSNKVIKIKSGGGQRGREIKNKTVKNKYCIEKKAERKSSEGDESVSLDFISEEEAIDLLRSKKDDDLPVELLHEIFILIQKQLDFKFKNECRSIILQTSDTAKMKQNHKNLEKEVTLMINKIKLFEKSFMIVEDVSLKNDLTKYCLKSLCSDLTNTLFEFVAHDNDLEWDGAMTVEGKSKLIGQLKSDLANKMKAICKSLKEETLEGFHSSFTSICNYYDLYPKSLDKKSEKRLIQEIGANYHLILDKKSENRDGIDPAELLLLTTLLLFQRITGFPLHASGKFVPDLLNYLQKYGTGFGESIDWVSLKIFENYVITTVKMTGSQELEKEALKIAHKDLQNRVIDLALNWKSIKSV